jgi:DNA-binding PucR family transcriptional regulator
VSFSDPSIVDVLTRLPDGLVRVTPADGSRPVRAVVIADAPDEVEPGAIVLAVARPAQAVRVAGERGAAAVVVRPRTVAQRREVAAAAGAAGVTLLELADGHGWSEVHAELVAALTRPSTSSGDELSVLAHTVATLTRGLVTIEDMQARVLAYSASTDEVDELRRLSILGRSGPPAYLALLREWGVYDQLAVPDEVVEIAEHPESGVRRRLAVGVFAGRRQLGTIWVQQGAEEFPPHARQALLGAARLAAVELTATRGRSAARADDALGALLSGRDAMLPGLNARTAQKACAVAVFALRRAGDDPAERLLRLDALAGVVRVHAAALRASALLTELDGRVYLLLPDLPAAGDARPMLQAVTATVRRHLGEPVQAAIGPVVDGVAAAASSRRGADEALAAAPRATVAVFDELRARLLVAAALAAVAERPELQQPHLRTLPDETVRTLLAYLDHGGDVPAAAAALQVHETTVRYRLRKAAPRLRLDLADPDTRLAVHLQLRMVQA